MEANIGKFFESVGNFFTGGDQIPWCERDVIAGCEREVAELRKVPLMNFSKNVSCDCPMLEASVSDANSSALQLRETVYLLAVGYYRSGDYSKSRELVEQCLMIAPAWRQALSLKKMNEDRIKEK
ncbi:hypothetical protein M0R45_016207 [Rubus argutus]|uniref:Tetratricopeptide repeat protein n=1 Tax=Rubus argutus TaxID=59490 RepID=A0AAW1XVJ7_RUBAR